jgi:hypothetical protein
MRIILLAVAARVLSPGEDVSKDAAYIGRLCMSAILCLLRSGSVYVSHDSYDNGSGRVTSPSHAVDDAPASAVSCTRLFRLICKQQIATSHPFRRSSSVAHSCV